MIRKLKDFIILEVCVCMSIIWQIFIAHTVIFQEDKHFNTFEFVPT